MAVTPGFINMLSGADEALLFDGRGQSDVRQGVTLEVLGEGWSMGPLNDALKREMTRDQWPEFRHDVTWTTLGQFLDTLAGKGVSPNVASFVGAVTVRMNELGSANRAPTALPAETMRLARRGSLDAGSYADVVVLDPAKVADRATYAKPMQYATGVVHVLVNGVPVIANGEHTGATPGRVVRGPGWKGR